MMIINGLPAETQITAADLRHAVGAVTHALLASAAFISAALTASLTGRLFLVVSFILWGFIMLSDASRIGRRDGNKQEKVPPRVVIREAQP